MQAVEVVSDGSEKFANKRAGEDGFIEAMFESGAVLKLEFPNNCLADDRSIRPYVIPKAPVMKRPAAVDPKPKAKATAALARIAAKASAPVPLADFDSDEPTEDGDPDGDRNADPDDMEVYSHGKPTIISKP